jgi:hypothetical protein
METAAPDLPNDVKAKLLELAKRVPEASRGDFLSSVRGRLADVALDHTHTVVYAVAGFVIGAILDHVLTMHVPFSDVILDITGGKLAWLFAALGGLFGGIKDSEERRRQEQVAKIVATVVGEELRRVLAKGGAK